MLKEKSALWLFVDNMIIFIEYSKRCSNSLWDLKQLNKIPRCMVDTHTQKINAPFNQQQPVRD